MQFWTNNLLGTSIAASESAISAPRAAASAFFASAPFPFPASALFPFPISAPFAFLTSAPLSVMASTSTLALFSPDKEKCNFRYTHSSVLFTPHSLWCYRHWWEKFVPDGICTFYCKWMAMHVSNLLLWATWSLQQHIFLLNFLIARECFQRSKGLKTHFLC